MAQIFFGKKIGTKRVLLKVFGGTLLFLSLPLFVFGSNVFAPEQVATESLLGEVSFAQPKQPEHLSMKVAVKTDKNSSSKVSRVNTTPTQENIQVQTVSATSALGSLENQILTLTNKARTSRGLKAFKSPSNLNAIAEKRSADMASKNYFSHTSPSGETAFSLLKKAGIGYKTAGENIGRNNYSNSQTASVVFNSWMASSGHKANILSSKFTSIGIGVVTNSSGMKYFTQVFIGN